MERAYTDGMISRKEGEENHINHRDIRENLDIGKNPYRGTIIKVGSYTYNKNPEELSYEEKVNQILEDFEKASQNSVDDLVNQEKMKDVVKQICSDPQNKADAFVTQQGNLNRANEIVTQSNAQVVARRFLANRDNER